MLDLIAKHKLTYLIKNFNLIIEKLSPTKILKLHDPSFLPQ
ncbi:hypothetical protein SAMN04488062_101239 [Flavobacterium omnivorum]|uniref:Uncharacterized protein n=1 Tax=Flavobacterium omnivorum TaxID=178355 RepID=A0A1G7VY66_9FLAO|nr:hypothetical protein SAMN04488062_101239 [Flavobacterium omnivorum]